MSTASSRVLISCLTQDFNRRRQTQSKASLWWKTPDWKNNNNHQRTSNASHRLKAAAVSVVQQQVAPWLQQEKKNRKREEELGDWLTFPVHAVAVGLEAAAPTASGACDEHGEPPGEHPHSRPMGTGHRAERRRPAGSPVRLVRS